MNPLKSTHKEILRTTLYIAVLLTLSVVFIALLSCVLALFAQDTSSSSEELLRLRVLTLHIITALPSLVFGFYLFHPGKLRDNINGHRIVGRIYVASTVVAAVTGLYLSFGSRGGITSLLGFGLLAAYWLLATLLAFFYVLKKDIVEHRLWAIRSYALTCAVITVRPMFMISPPFGMSDYLYIGLVSFLCWIPNALLAELYIYIHPKR